MDSECSDTNTSVFVSPDSAIEPQKGRKFETSISVSSLAEKFEKSGEFSKNNEKVQKEAGFDSTRELERNQSLHESLIPEINGFESESEMVKLVKEELCFFENCDIHGKSEVESVGDGIKTSEQSCKFSPDPNPSITQLKNESNANISHPITPAADVENLNVISQDDELSTDLNFDKEIAERVTYFINKLSENRKNSAFSTMPPEYDSNSLTGEAVQVSSDIGGKTSKRLSLKEMEQYFLDALNEVCSENKAKIPTGKLSVPSIEITEASDREDSSDNSEDESKPKSEEVNTEVKSSFEKAEETSTRETDDHESKPKSQDVNTEVKLSFNKSEETSTRETTADDSTSTSTGSKGDMKDEPEVSAEERKAFFYISSSNLPAETPHEFSENCNELQQNSENVECTDSTRTQESHESRVSRLRSKTCHGITFLISFIITVAGCMLYNSAYEGKAPDFCEYLGLIIAIIAGIVGVFSSFCYNCMGIFPGPSRAGYELIPDAGYVPTLLPQNETADVIAQNLDDDSSSEKEKAFKRQNMSSTRTSAASLKCDYQELVDKTLKVEKGVKELLDSFTALMSKLERFNKLVEMESGINE